MESKKIDKNVVTFDPNQQLMLKKVDMIEFTELKEDYGHLAAITYAGLFRCAVVALKEKIGEMSDEEFKDFYSQHKKIKLEAV